MRPKAYSENGNKVLYYCTITFILTWSLPKVPLQYCTSPSLYFTRCTRNPMIGFHTRSQMKYGMLKKSCIVLAHTHISKGFFRAEEGSERESSLSFLWYNVVLPHMHLPDPAGLPILRCGGSTVHSVPCVDMANFQTNLQAILKGLALTAHSSPNTHSSPFLSLSLNCAHSTSVHITLTPYLAELIAF